MITIQNKKDQMPLLVAGVALPAIFMPQNNRPLIYKTIETQTYNAPKEQAK